MTASPTAAPAADPAFVPATVVVPAGQFVMGATEDDRFASVLELPRRAVTIARPFALGVYPVTFREWDAYAAAVPEAHRPRDAGFGRGDLPVVNVSWRDAVGYCAWLSAVTGERWRLPAEAEWEYACRAGTTAIFHTGNTLSTDDANYLYTENRERVGLGRPTPVGSYPPNALGLHDMHGNVRELVTDHWHDGYAGAPPDGRAWLDEPAAGNPFHVARGGAWDEMPRLLRSAYRDWVHQDTRLDQTGFRVARDL